MRKYFVLQLKRLLRILPPILLVTAILFGGLAVVHMAATDLNDESGLQVKFPIGLVGTAGDRYFELGLAALGSFDSSRFTVEFIQMEEQEAQVRLRRGELTAYMLIPEGFMDAAISGHIMPIRFVSTVGSASLVSILKDEITRAVETLIIETQKGSYGAGDVAGSVGADENQVINDISLKYVEFVFARSKMYRVSEIGVFDGLGVSGYLVSGLGVVLFLLICLSFAPVMIRRDYALSRMLCARRIPVVGQMLCDFGVYMLGLLAVSTVVFVLLSFGGGVSLTAVAKGLPAMFALGAMSFLLYEIASDLVSGVLMQFFITLALCFLSGCLYPVAFFPETVQKMAAFLPTGLARMQLADCLRGGFSLHTTGMLLAFSGLFLMIATVLRKIKVRGAGL